MTMAIAMVDAMANHMLNAAQESESCWVDEVFNVGQQPISVWRLIMRNHVKHS